MITPAKNNVKENGIGDKNLTDARQFFTFREEKSRANVNQMQKVAANNQFKFMAVRSKRTAHRM